MLYYQILKGQLTLHIFRFMPELHNRSAPMMMMVMMIITIVVIIIITLFCQVWCRVCRHIPKIGNKNIQQRTSPTLTISLYQLCSNRDHLENIGVFISTFSCRYLFFFLITAFLNPGLVWSRSVRSHVVSPSLFTRTIR